MGRVKWKFLFFNLNSLKRTIEMKIRGQLKKKKRIVFNKSLTVERSFNNSVITVYKGCLYRRLRVNPLIIGRKLGEFILTRKPYKYLVKTKNKTRCIRR